MLSFFCSVVNRLPDTLTKYALRMRADGNKMAACFYKHDNIAASTEYHVKKNKL